MATLCVMLEESDREMQLPGKKKGFHFVAMRLDGLIFADQEVADYAQALGMMLLSAVRESSVTTKDILGQAGDE